MVMSNYRRLTAAEAPLRRTTQFLQSAVSAAIIPLLDTIIFHKTIAEVDVSTYDYPQFLIESA